MFKDVINYSLVINQDEIRHIKKDSVSIDDVISFINVLSKIVTNFDEVRYTIYNNSQNALRFRKKKTDGVYVALCVISNKNHTLRMQTLFLEKYYFLNKKRNLSPTLNESKTIP